ncbi:MAG: DUF502 domain-containing protein [Oleiphilaceae bacterium]|nr:DUF502 domain-containing protein [Oleiphilaceae bacterium]
MEYSKDYLIKTFVTGLVLLLPLLIVAVVFGWVFNLITTALQPATNLVVRFTGIPELASDLLVILALLAGIFLIGSVARTTMGSWLQPQIDTYMQRVAPGYRMVREIVQQLFGDRDSSPFAHGSVALVRLYGPDVNITATGIVTSHHDNGYRTVFVPTGPNPTSGFIYHVHPELVDMRPDIRVESALRTVIACGNGAGQLFGTSVDLQAHGSGTDNEGVSNAGTIPRPDRPPDHRP